MLITLNVKLQVKMHLQLGLEKRAILNVINFLQSFILMLYLMLVFQNFSILVYVKTGTIDR